MSPMQLGATDEPADVFSDSDLCLEDRTDTWRVVATSRAEAFAWRSSWPHSQGREAEPDFEVERSSGGISLGCSSSAFQRSFNSQLLINTVTATEEAATAQRTATSQRHHLSGLTQESTQGGPRGSDDTGPSRAVWRVGSVLVPRRSGRLSAVESQMRALSVPSLTTPAPPGARSKLFEHLPHETHVNTEFKPRDLPGTMSQVAFASVAAANAASAAHASPRLKAVLARQAQYSTRRASHPAKDRHSTPHRLHVASWQHGALHAASAQRHSAPSRRHGLVAAGALDTLSGRAMLRAASMPAARTARRQLVAEDRSLTNHATHEEQAMQPLHGCEDNAGSVLSQSCTAWEPGPEHLLSSHSLLSVGSSDQTLPGVPAAWDPLLVLQSVP